MWFNTHDRLLFLCVVCEGEIEEEAERRREGARRRSVAPSTLLIIETIWPR